MANFCQSCGTELPKGVKFCPGCGTPVDPPAPQPKAGSLPQPAEQAVGRAISGVMEQLAPDGPGEAVLGEFGGISGAAAQAGEILGPIKTVAASVKAGLGSLIGIFKNKQRGKLIAAGVLALVWIVLMVLSYLGIRIAALDWLTFAQGGAGRSAAGWVGGLLGKTTVAALLFKLIGGGYKSLGSGLKALFKGANFRTQNLGVLLAGAGTALAVYQFFAGSADWRDTMPALSGGLMAVMALGSENGFLFRLAQSLTAKVSGKVRTAQSEKTSALLSGVTCGFALGAAVSLVPFGWLPVILGGAGLIAGIVLMIVFRSKKEADAK